MNYFILYTLKILRSKFANFYPTPILPFSIMTNGEVIVNKIKCGIYIVIRSVTDTNKANEGFKPHQS